MDLDNLLAFLLILSAACYLLLGVYLISKRRDAGTIPTGLLFIVIGIWVIGSAIELMSSSFDVFSIGRTGHFVGTAFLPVVLYVCFREYTGAQTTARMLVLLTMLPIVSVTLAATNSFHELMWQPPFSNENGLFLTRPVAWGPWFSFIHAPLSYSIIGVAIATLLMHSSAVAPAHRRSLFLLATACIAPLVATLAYDLGYGPNTISFVPLVFAGMLPIYAWLILGERIAESSPMAYETVFQNIQDPVVVIDEQQRVIGLNRGAEKLLDLNENDALRAPIDRVFGEGSTCVFKALDTGQPQKMTTSTGRFLHIQASSIETGNRSTRGGKVLMFRDVSDVEHAQSKIRKNETLMRTLIDHSVNGIVRLRWSEDEDQGGKTLRCIFANAAAGRYLFEEPETMIDMSAKEIIQLATSGMNMDDMDFVLRKFEAAAATGTGIDTEVMQCCGTSGRWLRMICEPVGEDVAATFIDVTDGKARERQMESIAWSDPLTGVLNRRGFERDAAKRMIDSEDNATGALLFIDLNDFKKINDGCGHEVGDQLLTVAARRLRKSLRSCDIIGRPGGDEFVALVPDVSSETADKLATRLTRALEEPYIIGGESLLCAASIGLALYPENATTLTGLLREADQAMYRAKARCSAVPDKRAAGSLEKAV